MTIKLKPEKSSIIDKIEETNYIFTEDIPNSLIKPHGGILVDRFNPNFKTTASKTIEIDEETLMDLEQIAIGVFSPIEGFMESKDFNSVVEKMKLL